MRYELVGIPKNRDEVRDEFMRFIDRINLEKIETVEILFGWAWGNEIYKEPEWNYLVLSSKDVLAKVLQIEKDGLGRLGYDDLFVKVQNYSCEILFCHEGDIHLISSSKNSYIIQECESWIKKEWKVIEKIDAGEWTEVKI